MSRVRKQNALHGYAPNADPTTTVTITAADGKVTKVSAGATTGWGGNMKGGLFPTVGVSYHFNLMKAACCRNGGGKAPMVNIRDEDDNDDIIGN